MQSPWDLKTEYASHFNEKMELKFVNSLQRMIDLMDDQIMERINAFFDTKLFISLVARVKEELVKFRVMYDEKDATSVVISTPVLEFFLDKKFIVANNMFKNYLLKLAIFSCFHNEVPKILKFLGKVVDLMFKMEYEMSALAEQEDKLYSGLDLIKKSLISKEKRLQQKQLREIILEVKQLKEELLKEKNLLKIQVQETQLLQKNLTETLLHSRGLDYVQKVENSLNRVHNNFKQIKSSANLYADHYSDVYLTFNKFFPILKQLTGNEPGVFDQMEDFFGQIFFYLGYVQNFTSDLKRLVDFYNDVFIPLFENFY